MKRLLLTILIAAVLPSFAPVGGQAQGLIPRSEISALVSEFSLYQGTEVIQINGLTTTLLKKLIRANMDMSDPDEKAVYDTIKGVRKVSVFSYQDCQAATRDRFERKLGRILSHEYLLMDVKDGDNNGVHIYGVASEDGSSIKDFIVHVPGESALICLFGTLPLNALAGLQ